MIDAIVDLSHHNGPVDLATAKQGGILGIIHKATQGLAYTDSQYASRKRFAETLGFLWGAYHFGDGTDGAMQALHFLDVSDLGPETLLVLDLEENTLGESMGLKQAYDFITTIYQNTSQWGGKWPVLYGGFYLRQLLAGKPDAMLQNCPLWLADYRETPEVLPGWTDWKLLQYTDKGEVPGIGVCDRDKFNGDQTQLEKFWKG